MMTRGRVSFDHVFGLWPARHPYVASLLLVGIITALGLATAPFIRTANLDMVYLLAVLVSGLTWGRGPSIFTALVSAVAFDYCFIPPRFSLAKDDLPYIISLIGYIAVALATSALAAQSRELGTEHRARAEAEARVQTKDEILNHISHELRSPLNGVMGWTQLLERGDIDTDRLSRGLAGLEHSARLLARLVDDLLNAARINSGKLSVTLVPTSLAPIVAKAADIVAPTAEEKHIRIETFVEPVGETLADAQRIEQIVTNLLVNAVKFTPEGGRVTLRLRRVDQDIELSVSDTGVGIAPEFLPRVFDQFAQGEGPQRKRGLGLGLSIAKFLVEAHGGTIAVSSAGRGRGATFTVKLPAGAAVYDRASIA